MKSYAEVDELIGKVAELSKDIQAKELELQDNGAEHTEINPTEKDLILSELFGTRRQVKDVLDSLYYIQRTFFVD